MELNENNKKKFPAEKSASLNQKKKEKNQKKKKKREEDKARIRAWKEAQKEKKREEKERSSYPRVPGLNRATIKALLGEEEPEEEKPKEEEEEEEEIICPPTPPSEFLSKKRLQGEKEKMRRDLNVLWGEARSRLIKEREEEVLDRIVRIPHDWEPERVQKEVLRIIKESEETYNIKYEQEIARINKKEKPLIVNFYKAGGQGPKKKLPPFVPPEDKFKTLFGGDIKEIIEERRRQMEEKNEEEEIVEVVEEAEEEDGEEEKLKKLNLLKEEDEEPKKEEPKEEPKEEESEEPEIPKETEEQRERRKERELDRERERQRKEWDKTHANPELHSFLERMHKKKKNN